MSQDNIRKRKDGKISHSVRQNKIAFTGKIEYTFGRTRRFVGRDTLKVNECFKGRRHLVTS